MINAIESAVGDISFQAFPRLLDFGNHFFGLPRKMILHTVSEYSLSQKIPESYLSTGNKQNTPR